MIKDSFGFKTRDDLLEIFHNVIGPDGKGSKEHLVNDLIARKTRLGHFRWHPEFVGCRELMQYWVPRSKRELDKLFITPTRATSV